MIRVSRVAKPRDFDRECAQPGNQWLATHRKGRPRDFWSPFLDELRKGFRNRCGYSALWDLNGTVDHYLSCQHHRRHAYNWRNYRYISGSINSSKRTHDDAILDPFKVRDDWFELDLLTLQLLPTRAIPPRERARANFTLKKLRLRNGKKILAQRRAWYEQFKADRFGTGPQAIDNLREFAPQIAVAIERWKQANPGQPLP